MNARQFEQKLRALARRDGMTFSGFANAGVADRAVLVETIVRRFDPASVYREREVNEILKAWLAGAGAMLETDHVNVRRWLVDTNVLARTPDCAEYRLMPAAAQAGDEDAAAIRRIDVDGLVAATRAEDRETRAQRKAAWLARGSGAGGEGAGDSTASGGNAGRTGR